MLCVHSGSQYVLIDVIELVFRPGLVHELLTLDESLEMNNFEMNNLKDITHVEEGAFFYKKSGPVPLDKKYPQILVEIMNFVKLHGFAADSRRRNTTLCGVTIENIHSRHCHIVWCDYRGHTFPPLPHCVV